MALSATLCRPSGHLAMLPCKDYSASKGECHCHTEYLGLHLIQHSAV